MSEVKICSMEEVPAEGEVRQIEFDHPWTDIRYALAMFYSGGRYLLLRDECQRCGSSLAKGTLKGQYAFCSREQHAWNIKTGLYKFDRRLSLPTYRGIEKDDGIYIEI